MNEFGNSFARKCLSIHNIVHERKCLSVSPRTYLFTMRLKLTNKQIIPKHLLYLLVISRGKKLDEVGTECRTYLYGKLCTP